MHVLSVPGKASIEETKAAVVSLKFLRFNKEKQKTGRGSKNLHYHCAEENCVWVKQDLRCWIIEYLWKQHWRTHSTWGALITSATPGICCLQIQARCFWTIKILFKGKKNLLAICLQPCLNQVSHLWHPLGSDHSRRLSLVLPQLSSNHPKGEAGNIRNRGLGHAALAHSPI